MKVVTNSVLTVDLDERKDRDFLAALEKISKRDNTTLEKAFDGVVSNFLTPGGEPPVFCPKGGEPPCGAKT